ncbi:MAG TPA: hypothetical protein VNW25_07040 [Candidatus Sulfotelmatobacter sp.]|nr:hypothetical protein [Candidatus Sulfotelmatobacter sp.]
MDPVIFEFIGGILVGSFGGLMVVLRNRRPSPETMPTLTIRKPRSASSGRRRRNSPLTKRGRTTITVAKMGRKAKNKTPNTVALSQTPVVGSATVSFDTCPSCGLQAPGALLTEHFLGSPSHRNGIPKTVEAAPVDLEAAKDANEEDSKQSVRNLLQMLVPPRAFGHRHAYRSMSPISPIIKNSGPTAGRTNRL